MDFYRLSYHELFDIALLLYKRPHTRQMGARGRQSWLVPYLFETETKLNRATKSRDGKKFSNQPQGVKQSSD